MTAVSNRPGVLLGGVALGALILVVARGFALGPPSGARAAQGRATPVNVFYAASLANVNERHIGPAFRRATGYAYQGKAAGSLAIANEIEAKLDTPDVIELADPSVNHLLMGPAHGDIVSWYMTFARTTLVVAFDPRSTFARAFRAVQSHRLPWYRALEQPGIRLGRTDPNLDPKGYRTLFMVQLAQHLYHLPHFQRRVIGAPENPSQIFPEEVLAARLETGQIDAGILYLSEARALHIPYISLPAKVNLGSVKYARLYALEHFTTSQGLEVRGAPILFTVTIPRTVHNRPGAIAFISFILSRRGRVLAAQDGLLTTRVTVHGRGIPAGLRGLLAAR